MLTAPLNKLWLKGTELSGAAQGFFDVGRDIGDDDDSANLRGRWERSRIYRALSAMTAFMLATSAAVS